jgi:hypothetical protein
MASWDIENGVLQRPSRRKKGKAQDLLVHEFAPVVQSQSGVSENVISKLKERNNRLSVHDDEYEYDDPMDKFELDEDCCWRPRGDNRAFARLVFADALKRKIKRAEIQLAVSDTKFEIGNVRAARRTIDHEFRLLNLNQKSKMKKCHFTFDVSQIGIDPWVKEVNYSQAGGQTRVIADYFEDTNRQIAMNEKIIQRRSEIQKKSELLTEHYQFCQQRLEMTEQTIDEMTEIGDQLERRYRLVRPLDGQIIFHPSVQRRIDLQQNVVQQKNEIMTIQHRTQRKSGDLRKLKCRIDDQKCVLDMLHRKIAEARGTRRPNVPLMWKSLEGMKKQAKLEGESVRVLGIEERCVTEVLAERRNTLTREVLQKRMAVIEPLKEKVQKAR